MFLLGRSGRFQLSILILLGFFTNQISAASSTSSSASVSTSPSNSSQATSVVASNATTNSYNSNITTTTNQPVNSTSSGSVNSNSTSTGNGGSTVAPAGSGGSSTPGSGGSTETSGGSGGSNGTSDISGGSTGSSAGSGGSNVASTSSGYDTSVTVGSASNTGPTVSGGSIISGNSMTTTAAVKNLGTSTKVVTGGAINQQTASGIQYITTIKGAVLPLKVTPDFVENSRTLATTYYAEITLPSFLGLMIFIIVFMTVTAGKAACLIKPCTKGQVEEDYKLL